MPPDVNIGRDAQHTAGDFICPYPDRSLGLETNMSRIALICCFPVLLGSCGSSMSSSVANVDIEHARQACAYLGITPGTSAFAQCSTNLYLSLSTAQSEAHE